MIRQAMVFAAGFGKRLQPLTLKTPKPLLEISYNVNCLGLILKRLRQQGFNKVVVNAHYLADQIEAFLKNNFPEVILSYEPCILDTGGGLLNALPYFDSNAPILIANSDIYIDDESAYLTLLNLFTDHADALLGLVEKERAKCYKGLGDYFFNDNLATYNKQKVDAPFIYSGISVIHPNILQGYEVQPFSLVDVFHKAESFNRLHGHLFTSLLWHDIGSLEALEELRKYIC